MKCPTCESERWKQRTTLCEKVIGGRTFKAELTAQVCAKCGTVLVARGELEQFEHAVAVALASACVRSGDAIRTMRKAIGLDVAALAELFDVSTRTILRWE